MSNPAETASSASPFDMDGVIALICENTGKAVCPKCDNYYTEKELKKIKAELLSLPCRKCGFYMFAHFYLMQLGIMVLSQDREFIKLTDKNDLNFF